MTTQDSKPPLQRQTNENEGASQTAAPEKDTSPEPVKNGYRSIIWLTVIILLVGLTWFLLWFYDFRWREYTDDAYVNGNMVNVTPVVSGTPIAFFADDTDLVEEGQLLVQLDETPFRLALEKELATLASTALQVAQYYNSVKASIASLQSKQITYERFRYDFENRLNLIDAKAVSGEDYVHAKDMMDTALEDLKLAEAQLNVSIDAAGHVINQSGEIITPPEQHPLILAQKAVIREAYYNLQHCNVYAPCTGYIAQRTVEVGQAVSPTSYMMAIIPINYMWVDANYKETQLTDVRVGQPVKVYIDLYGSGVEYKGKVLGIASGTGSVFSLIPPQNATGNWIKIVQRLPVRVSLDPETMKKYPLRLGLSAEVYIDIADTDLPYLAQIPSTKSISTTHVFKIDFSDIDKKMDEIIKKNLGKIPQGFNGKPLLSRF